VSPGKARIRRPSASLLRVQFRPLTPGVLCVCCSLTLGCSGDPPLSHGTGGVDPSGGMCNAVPKSVTGLGQTHVESCSPVSYPDNPPAGGNHYPVWAAFQSFSFPVPRGFWVHDLEHGAVVYSYNCPDGCADEVEVVTALIQSLPADPGCDAQTPRRVVLTPDPLLDVRWGLSAWGHTERADCVDPALFVQFYSNHIGLGPEQLCSPGSDFGGAPPCPQ
jgi:Protein of unknown function (DUF3105)